ncbi:MAG: hypothetical protein WBA74_13750 [Cyclobacteriaceae bacterium]
MGTTYKISTEYTFFFKFILPISYICILGGFSALLITQGETRAFIATILFNIGGSYLLYRVFGQLKSVSIDKEFFYISNYIKTAKVPIADMVEVEDRSWPGSYKPISIYFRHNYYFGNRITFLPEFEDPNRPSGIPLAEKLRRLL